MNKSDTTWILFWDSTYEMWSVRGQQQNGKWKLNEIKNSEFLTLGGYCPDVYEIQDKTDKTLVLKEVASKESKGFILNRLTPKTFKRRIEKIKNGC